MSFSTWLPVISWFIVGLGAAAACKEKMLQVIVGHITGSNFQSLIALNLQWVGVESPWYKSLVAAKNWPTQDLRVHKDPCSVNLGFS